MRIKASVAMSLRRGREDMDVTCRERSEAERAAKRSGASRVARGVGG